MDTKMPEMDGITATRLIRADERFAQRPIIIAMTAHNASDNPDDILATGANDYLPKPIDFSKLATMLCHWLQQLPAPSNNDLPSDLPPFDIAAALVRTSGNAPLLRKLMVMFYNDYQQAIAHLNQLCADQDYVQAERFAHSLKSVAGTLEARELFEAAFALEKALRNRDIDELATNIEALNAQLVPALTAAASLNNN
jgi:CheY-like chemotaxis protein